MIAENGRVAGAGLMPDLHLTRQELASLTGTVQAKRMADWLTQRGWVFEPAARRSDIPKVSRSYHQARMSGQPLPGGAKQRQRLELDCMLSPS